MGRNRRRIFGLVGLVTTILVATSLPAAAYVDKGYDPEDQPDSYDVRSTVRRVEQGKRGRYLKVVVRIYEGQPPLDQLDYVWSMDVRLDSRGGRAADAILRLWSYDNAGSGCDLTKPSGRLLKHGRLRTGPQFASCRVPVHPLHPRKRIRWRVAVTDNPGSQDPPVDVAPDVGMYS